MVSSPARWAGALVLGQAARITVEDMTVISSAQTHCQCPVNCNCGNTADLVHDGVSICGCCLAGLSDVHGSEGKTWRLGYWVRPVLWSGGYELHVDGIGVTQCSDLADAEVTVRDFLEALGLDDARTVKIRILKTRG